ncbi:phage regulatory CII family protein [Pseudacidovorax intermedius]|uniref:Phage regulatory protein CII n=1 Tax=Pseudacidovorax intermedius TaxID=433924 RepID=A0A147GM78_9BURK|nr:phage regulatory CII family protein [Pseudacidovorax intermedius]KTT14736.1 hypothetical protein NS331_22560 [Pseudacidovorax intermedius]
MHCSFTMSSGPGHVDNGAAPDMAGPMSMDEAVWHVVHDYEGGLDEVARHLGIPSGTLQHKVNRNNKTHYLRPEELLAAMLFTGNAHALHAMAAALGFVCTRATPDQAGGDPVEAVMRLEVAQADFIRALADAVLAGDGQVTRNQVRRAEAMGQELIASVGHAVAMLRGRMRPAPAATY